MSQDPQRNLEVMRHWLNTVNSNNLQEMLKEFAEIITDDYLLHDPSTPDLQPGAADYLKIFEKDLAGSAERKVTIGDIFAVDDKVIMRGTYEFLDLATRKHKNLAGMVISQFKDGKLKEEWQIIAPFNTPSTQMEGVWF